MNTLLFALALVTPNQSAIAPPMVITLSETVIVVPAPRHTRRCETRDLVQGSGSVRVCETVVR